MSPADDRTARDRDIARMARSMTIKQIAKLFGVSISTINRVTARAGVKPVSGRPRAPEGLANFDEELLDRQKRLKAGELMAAALEREIASATAAKSQQSGA